MNNDKSLWEGTLEENVQSHNLKNAITEIIQCISIMEKVECNLVTIQKVF